MLAVIAVLAFSVNLRFGTDYLFIGMPPALGFVRIIYEMVPLWLYLPVAVTALCLIETAAIVILNGLTSLSEKLPGRSVRKNGFGGAERETKPFVGMTNNLWTDWRIKIPADRAYEIRQTKIK